MVPTATKAVRVLCASCIGNKRSQKKIVKMADVVVVAWGAGGLQTMGWHTAHRVRSLSL